MAFIRQHLTALAGVIAALWVFAFLVALINGCAGSGLADHQASVFPHIVSVEHQHGTAHDHAGAGSKIICAGVCKAASTASFSHFVTEDGGFNTLALLPLSFFGAAIALLLPPIRRFAYSRRPVKPPAAIVFLRLNN